MLISANSVPILAPAGNDVVTIPPSLAVFRVGDDGKLDYVGKTDVDVVREPQPAPTFPASSEPWP